MDSWGHLKMLLINLPVFWQICEQLLMQHLGIILRNESILSLLYECMLVALKSTDTLRGLFLDIAVVKSLSGSQTKTEIVILRGELQR